MGYAPCWHNIKFTRNDPDATPFYLAISQSKLFYGDMTGKKSISNNPDVNRVLAIHFPIKTFQRRTGEDFFTFIDPGLLCSFPAFSQGFYILHGPIATCIAFCNVMNLSSVSCISLKFGFRMLRGLVTANWPSIPQ